MYTCKTTFRSLLSKFEFCNLLINHYFFFFYHFTIINGIAVFYISLQIEFSVFFQQFTFSLIDIFVERLQIILLPGSKGSFNYPCISFHGFHLILKIKKLKLIWKHHFSVTACKIYWMMLSVANNNRLVIKRKLIKNEQTRKFMFHYRCLYTHSVSMQMISR